MVQPNPVGRSGIGRGLRGGKQSGLDNRPTAQYETNRLLLLRLSHFADGAQRHAGQSDQH